MFKTIKCYWDSRLFCQKLYLTRMTTFIKTKFKISDDQTNIGKYRLAANITEYHIISKVILQRIIITNLCCSESHLRQTSISDLESPSKFQVKDFFKNRSINKEIGLIWSSESFEVKYNIRFEIPIEFPSQRRKNYWNWLRNNEIMLNQKCQNRHV